MWVSVNSLTAASRASFFAPGGRHRPMNFRQGRSRPEGDGAADPPALVAAPPTGWISEEARVAFAVLTALVLLTQELEPPARDDDGFGELARRRALAAAGATLE
jgi:hypothetical protein